MTKEKILERLFAAARQVEVEETSIMPAGFAEGVLRQHCQRVQEDRTFSKASVISIGTALIILGTVLGINYETTNSSGSDDQESMVEMAYALWDPVGN
jgi:hypothetical protein